MKKLLLQFDFNTSGLLLKNDAKVNKKHVELSRDIDYINLQIYPYNFNYNPWNLLKGFSTCIEDFSILMA